MTDSTADSGSRVKVGYTQLNCYLLKWWCAICIYLVHNVLH